MKEPITVVVPVKNRATLVLRTLNSIKAQSWRPLKVIVVDNGSTDGTAESVGSWIEANKSDDFEVHLLEEPKPGAAAARNAGLEGVDTRLMMFFDSDDFMAPEHVETVMNRFHGGDDPDLIVFRVRYHPIEGEDSITKRPGADMMTMHICHGLLRTAAFACETALARRVGGWDEELGGWDDLDFGSRILMEARRRVFLSDINVDVFAQIDSITGTKFSSRKGEWEKVLDKMEKNFMKSGQRKRDKWMRTLAYKRAILAASYHREKAYTEARTALETALGNKLLNPFQRLFLKGAYRFTALGGRGTALFVNMIL